MRGRLLDVNRGSCKIDKGMRVEGEQKRGARGEAWGCCEESALALNDGARLALNDEAGLRTEGTDAVVWGGFLPLMGK